METWSLVIVKLRRLHENFTQNEDFANRKKAAIWQKQNSSGYVESSTKNLINFSSRKNIEIFSFFNFNEFNSNSKN